MIHVIDVFQLIVKIYLIDYYFAKNKKDYLIIRN